MVSTRLVTPLPKDAQPAALQTISMTALAAGDPIEAAKLFDAGTKDGFFYLDFSGPEHTTLLDTVDALFGTSKHLFNLPEEEKMQYDVDTMGKLKLNGYKPLGRNVSGTNGRRDGFESYALPRNGIEGLTPETFCRPAIVDDALPILLNITTTLTSHAQVIFRTLSNCLQLPESHTFESYHRPSQPSPDLIRLLKYHANTSTDTAPQTPHTDLGSLTFVFATTPGLQVMRPSSADWEAVEPRARHAIVNLGDAMTIWTNGLLHSCLHRVAPLPGQAMDERYSMAFLMRPEDKAVMKALPSPLVAADQPEDAAREVFTSGEWIARKFGALRGQNMGKIDEYVLTGRTDSVMA